MILTGYQGKNVLLLQGPAGPYFRRLAKTLTDQGATVHKINFNGGDILFYPSGITYRGNLSDLPAFIEDQVSRLHIHTIMLFGDCRPVHERVHEICHRRNLDLRVFEEGYLRPNFVTCERYGVNGYSAVPRSPSYYRSRPYSPEPTVRPVGNAYWHMVRSTMLYYMASTLMNPLFPRYKHHRNLSLIEALPWLRGAWRKHFYRAKERQVQARLCGELAGRFFLVPLQVHNDTQVTVHSRYSNVGEFIQEVAESFARSAPANTLLVFKHHPMDRAYTDYTRLIRSLGDKLGIRERVMYIHDQHLPSLLDAARGAVVINSTVGLGAIHQAVPTKACGDALYDFDGLTFRGPLDEFWTNVDTAQVDMDLYARFRAHLIQHTQINDNLYKPLPPTPAVTPQHDNIAHIQGVAR